VNPPPTRIVDLCAIGLRALRVATSVLAMLGAILVGMGTSSAAAELRGAGTANDMSTTAYDAPIHAYDTARHGVAAHASEVVVDGSRIAVEEPQGTVATVSGPLSVLLSKSVAADSAAVKGAPKTSPNFKPPTNAPQLPPNEIPAGWQIREMPPTADYPNGYWKLEKPTGDGHWQPIDPSTMKPGTRPETHIPFPGGG